jgi:hypothetical protein
VLPHKTSEAPFVQLEHRKESRHLCTN